MDRRTSAAGSGAHLKQPESGSIHTPVVLGQRPRRRPLTRRQLFARALPLTIVLAAPFAACRPAPRPEVRIASAPVDSPPATPRAPVPTPGSYWTIGTPVPARAVLTNPVTSSATNPTPASGSAPASALATPPEPLYPLAVLVENSPNARPQSGLGQADVVYEALAEGGISRFLAVYFTGNAASIGPVRSARDYFVNIAAEFNASLVHIGASPGGYDSLKRIGLHALDETHGHPGFERIRARVAPHNAYTSTDSARAALQQVRGAPEPGSWGGLRFRQGGEAGPSGDNGRTLTVRYAPYPYAVRYSYDATARRYARVMGGAPHRDSITGEQLGGKNVVVLTVPSRVIDAEGRLALDQVGTGKALVLSGGRAVDGRWTKPVATAPLELRDPANLPMLLAPGQTWVQIVPTEAVVSLDPA